MVMPMPVLRLLTAYATAAALLLAPTAAAFAQDAPATPPAADRLPVRRVVLYKSGVGYFEHLGRIRDSQTVSIDLTSGQLDDVLKSLTTVDMGDGRVTGITFNSTAPLDQRLRTLSLPLGPLTTRRDLLHALRGTRVEVQGAGQTTTGRILSVHERQRAVNAGLEPVEALTLVTEAGAVRTFDLGPGVGVRVLDADLRRELTQYLDLVGSARAQDVRRLSVATSGTGLRNLFVSYVSEVPVWKTTYRLVVPSESAGKPFLQGWAVVDNTLGEDWTDVELSLVAGAPQSFVQPMSQPLYNRRPVVPLATGALTTPQTHDGITADAPPLSDPGLAANYVAELAEARSMRAAPDRTTTAALPPPAPFRAPTAAEVAEKLSAHEAAASGADLGDLFEYKLTQPITIRRNQSALVPIAQAEVTVERVSLWNAANAGSRPLRALWLTNDTGLTLDGGSLTLVEGGAFAGEGLLDPIAPGEKRFISYATDLAGRVTVSRDGGAQRVSRIAIARGVMTQRVEDRARSTYTVRNEDAAARDFIIEHPVRDGWRLVPATATPVESTAGQHRFRVTVAPHTSATLSVDEVRPVESKLSVTNLDASHVALILRGRDLPAGIESELRALVDQSAEVARLQSEVRTRSDEVTRIGDDQTRIRENLSALKGSREERQLTARYTRQLTDQEDRLDALRAEVASLEAQLAAARQTLARLAEAISLDVELP